MTGAAQTFSIVPVVIRQARIQAALVAGAELQNHVLFNAMPAKLLGGLKNSKRLRNRLLDALVSEFGEPMLSTLQTRRFYCLSDGELADTAFCLGLSYEISMFGGALEADTLKKLTQSCNERTVLKALKHATHIQTGLIKGRRNPPTTESDVLQANGWSLLNMWACANGINPDWRIASHRTTKTNLGVVFRDRACSLVDAVMLDTSTTLDPC